MSLVETLLRAGAAVFLVVGQLAAAHWIACRLVGAGPPLLRWTAVLLVGMGVSTLGFHVLATAQLFTLPAALVAMALLLALVLGRRQARELWRAHLARERAALRRIAQLLRRSPRLFWIGAAAAAMLSTFTRPWVIPPLGWDTLVYHATKAGMWVQAGGLRYLDGIGSWSYFRGYPAGGEVFTAWAMLPLHADTLAMGAEAVQLAGVLIAMIALARELGAREPFATTAAFVFATLPPLRHVVGSGYVETGMCLTFAGGAAFAVRYLKRGGAGALALACVGLALSVGIKVTMAPMAAVLLVAMLARAIAARRGRGLVAGAVLFVALASPWYVYNVIDTGRPLSPHTTRVAGVELGNPTPGQRAAFDGLAASFPAYELDAEWAAFKRTMLLDARQPEALGPIAGLVLVVLLAAAPAWLRRGPGVAIPLLLVVVVNLAYLYGREAAPLRLAWPESTARFWLPAFAIAVPASTLWCRRAPRAGRLYLGLLLVIGFHDALRFVHLHHQSYDLLAQLGLVVAVAAAVVACRLAPPRRRAAVALALAVVLVAGLDRAANPRRYVAFSRSMIMNFTPTVWIPAALAVDHPRRPHRVAVTGGPAANAADAWFAYGLLGSRLQNHLEYVPITSDGRVVDHPDRVRSAGDAAAWLRRLRERRIEYVASLTPGTVESAWMRADPERFERVSHEPVTAGRGRGVWRVKPDAAVTVQNRGNMGP